MDYKKIAQGFFKEWLKSNDQFKEDLPDEWFYSDDLVRKDPEKGFELTLALINIADTLDGNSDDKYRWIFYTSE